MIFVPYSWMIPTTWFENTGRVRRISTYRISRTDGGWCEAMAAFKYPCIVYGDRDLDEVHGYGPNRFAAVRDCIRNAHQESKRYPKTA